jgi:hypothetical protein
MSKKKGKNDTIGNRARDVPVCSVVPQPTAPPQGKTVLKSKTLVTELGIETLLYYILH